MAEEASWRGLGKSLLTLEINTIVKPSITAERMPALPHALLDIAQEYSGELLDQGVLVEEYLVQPPRGDATAALAQAQSVAPFLRSRAGETPGELRRLLAQEVRANVTTFQLLRSAARRRQAGRIRPALGRREDGTETEPDGSPLLPRPDAGRRALLERIINNADLLVVILRRNDRLRTLSDLTRGELHATDLAVNDIPAGDRMAIAKFWEIGMEEVLTQSVVSLAGDVTTRVVPRMLRPENAPVLAVHHQSVDVGLACWKNLAAAAAGVVRLVLGRPAE